MAAWTLLTGSWDLAVDPPLDPVERRPQGVSMLLLLLLLFLTSSRSGVSSSITAGDAKSSSGLWQHQQEEEEVVDTGQLAVGWRDGGMDWLPAETQQ